MPRVRRAWSSKPWYQLCSAASAGSGNASHSALRASAARSGASAETCSNHRRLSGVTVTRTMTAVNPAARYSVKRQRPARAPGSSSSATTTSLNASPTLRNEKRSPFSTGQTASEMSADGIRLSAALPMGCARKESSEVRTSGM